MAFIVQDHFRPGVVLARSTAPVTGERVATAMKDFVRADPSRATRDWLVDLSEGLERYGPAHTDIIAGAFEGRPQAGCRTVMVSQDPSMWLFARTLDFRFSGRAHIVAPTFEQALALLS
jgi:hypothetical protein